MATETFAQHFLARVQQYGGSKIALRQKELGIWQEFSWQQSYEEVRAFGLGLLALGMQRGEHFAAIGDNDRQYLWGYLAGLAVGGALVGLYTDASAEEAAYIIDHSDAVFVLAQDQEQVDKMLEIRDRLPKVRRVIYWNEAGLWEYDDPWLMAYDEVRQIGLDCLRDQPQRFEQEVALGKSADLALICYTSGTTGLPKGAMLTHHNLLRAIELFADVDPRYDTDNHVSFLPMGWIAEHVLGVAAHCYFGVIINFPEEPETVRQNVREIAPEIIVYNSRLWDNLVSMIQVRMQDATWIDRQLYRLFMPVGYRVADHRLRGEALGGSLSVLNWLGDRLFFGQLRNQLGLSRVRTAITGGAVLSPDVIRFFHGIGINLKQVYGMTEVATAGACHRDGDIKFASVGAPIPGINIRISPRGEIEIASPTLFEGYYKEPDKTAKDVVVDPDGTRWFQTGDAGYIDDDGHLIYLDRLKDMIELSNGERFSPQFIEGRLKFSPYIRDVMAIGDPTRDSVTALIIIDFDNVARWAERRALGFTTFADLSQKPAVLDLVKAAVEEVNASLPPDGRVRAFVLMAKEFDADEAEMTRSRKLRRGVLLDKYGDIVEAMYDGSRDVAMTSTVTYQDGTSATLTSQLHVVRLGGPQGV